MSSDSRANRFALLAGRSPKAKKKKRNHPLNEFPPLPSPSQNPNPKFIIISSEDKNKPLTSFSCFAIHRSLLAISKDIISISSLRDGGLLLLVKNKATAKKFTASKEIPDLCKIAVKYHESLNYSKGTIYAPFLNNISEEEIVKELESQGVASAYKFKKIIEGKSVPSGVVLLSS